MAITYHEPFVFWVADGDVATHALGEVLARKMAERGGHVDKNMLPVGREVEERWNP